MNLNSDEKARWNTYTYMCDTASALMHLLYSGMNHVMRLFSVAPYPDTTCLVEQMVVFVHFIVK